MNQVPEVELISDFLVKLSYSEEKVLKEDQRTDLIKKIIARDFLSNFRKYDFWLMRYKDVVQEDYEKAENQLLEEDMEEDDEYGGYYGYEDYNDFY